jgi:hypothetical protein
MWEGGGSQVMDVSGNGHTGTLTNMDPATDWVHMPVGNGLDFDNTNDYVSCGLLSVPWSAGFTVAALARVDSVSEDQRLMSVWADASSDRAFLVWMDADGAAPGWAAVISAAGYSQSACGTDTATATTGQLAYVVLVYSNNEMSVYVDGALTASASSTVTPQTAATSPFVIGRAAPGTSSSYFDGQVACAAVWRRALISSEISELHSDPWSLIRPRQRSYWFVGASSSTPSASIIPIIGYHRRWMKVA